MSSPWDDDLPLPTSGLSPLEKGGLLRHYLSVKGSAEGLDFSGAALDEAPLIGAHLEQVNLKRASLSRARLRGARLQLARLEFARFVEADLQWANLTSAHAKGADFRRALLQAADLQAVDLRGARLEEADLQGANLQWAELPGAKLQGARLQGASLQKANLWEADLTGALLKGANLRGARLESAVLVGADLRRTNLREADLREAALDGADLRGASLLSAGGRPGRCQGARLDAETFSRSGWAPEELVAWQKAGATLEGFPDRWPQAVQDALLGPTEGLVFYLAVPITPFERYLLESLVFGALGPDTDCQIVSCQEVGGRGRVRLTAGDVLALVTVAEAFCARIWEGSRSRPLALADPACAAALSLVADQLEQVVWRSPDPKARPRERAWSAPVHPAAALEHLLSGLFRDDVDGLMRFLEYGRGGADVIAALPWQDVTAVETAHRASAVLLKKGLVDPIFFQRLAEQFPARAGTVAAIEALLDV
jgi:uncharacterized protein YjbI with pentapeptide repeats